MNKFFLMIMLYCTASTSGLAAETSIWCVSQETTRRLDGLSKYVALVSIAENPRLAQMTVAARPMNMGFQEAIKAAGVKATMVETNGSQFIGSRANHDELFRLTLGQELYNNAEVREATLTLKAHSESPIEKTMICFIEGSR